MYKIDCSLQVLDYISTMGYSSSCIICIFLFLLPYSALSQGKGTIFVGSSLTAMDETTSWYSTSGDFALGFQRVQEKDQFLLSIWYDKIPDKTIVWFVNDGTTVSTGSKVQLTADRGLVLSDSQGRELWISKPFSGIASNGVFSDTGNFEIVGRDSAILWDSFSNPTDTLLPTQTMHVGGSLFSRWTETNFAKGRFQLHFLDDGNLVLKTREIHTNNPYDAYYSSDTSHTNSSNQGYRLKFNKTGYMCILRKNGSIVKLTPDRAIPLTEYYHRATLNFDGVLVQYYHPKVFTAGMSKWTAVWNIPENICREIQGYIGRGACGYNNVCKLDDSGRANCECLESYSLIDPNDKHGSCKPNFTPSCKPNFTPS